MGCVRIERMRPPMLPGPIVLHEFLSMPAARSPYRETSAVRCDSALIGPSGRTSPSSLACCIARNRAASPGSSGLGWSTLARARASLSRGIVQISCADRPRTTCSFRTWSCETPSTAARMSSSQARSAGQPLLVRIEAGSTGTSRHESRASGRAIEARPRTTASIAVNMALSFVLVRMQYRKCQRLAPPPCFSPGRTTPCQPGDAKRM